MTPIHEYSTVHQNATVKEAIDSLKKSFFLDEQGNVHGHASLLVVNQNKELVGILTLKSILEALVLVKKENENVFNSYYWLYFLDETYKSAAGIPVKKIMRSRRLVSVKTDNDIMSAVELMVKHKVNSIPVINGAGRLVGILRSKDVFGMINELL
ncbi:CBS domain containing protein [Desulforamulus reducens MI-1]|uniref:CBS domain containing protein n=2 Tax=Desulforamulus TaxID=2916693 RepID=A4J5I5_DESRM|nr:CBS domain containing protein [Desulforamulus reducens MI-1]